MLRQVTHEVLIFSNTTERFATELTKAMSSITLWIPLEGINIALRITVIKKLIYTAPTYTAHIAHNHVKLCHANTSALEGFKPQNQPMVQLQCLAQ